MNTFSAFLTSVALELITLTIITFILRLIIISANKKKSVEITEKLDTLIEQNEQILL